jgi:hypothetical protein
VSAVQGTVALLLSVDVLCEPRPLLCRFVPSDAPLRPDG